MSHVIPLVSPMEPIYESDPDAPHIRTEAIHVVFTSVNATLSAMRVAACLARSMDAVLQLVHFRAVPYALSVSAPGDVSPIQTDDFMNRVRSEGIDVGMRVCLCRNGGAVAPLAFKPHSIIVIGGRHRRWRTSEERLRSRLEAAGHYVLFVDEREDKETSGV